MSALPEGFTPFPPDSPFLKTPTEVPRPGLVDHLTHRSRINTPQMTHAEAMEALAAGTLTRSVLTEKGHVCPT